MEHAKPSHGAPGSGPAVDGAQGDDPVRFHFDAHLVMNGLNRIASRYHARTGEECEDLFELADYLKFALQLTPSPQVSLSMEARLLEHYLRLLNLKSGRLVELQVRLQEGAQSAQVRPHSSCDVLGTVLGVVALGKLPVVRMDIVLGAGSQHISLWPDPSVNNLAEKLRDVQRRLDALQLPAATQVLLHS